MESTKKEINEKVFAFLSGLGNIFLYFILASIGSLLFFFLIGSENKVVSGIGQILVYLFMLLILAIIYHKRLVNDAKNFKKEYFKVALKNWLIGLGFMYIFNIFITFFIKDIAVNESINRELLTAYPITNILSRVFFGPMLE